MSPQNTMAKQPASKPRYNTPKVEHKPKLGQTGFPLYVAGVGLCCAVGYNLAAATAAMRANMDHFQESSFYDRSGKPLLVARLPIDNIWGARRLGIMAYTAVSDLMAQHPFVSKDTALILIGPETARFNSEQQYYQTMLESTLSPLTKKGFCNALPTDESGGQERPYPLFKGRAGFGQAVSHAAELLKQKSITNVLLLAVDSYIDTISINHYLATDQLLTDDNAAGFIPGEAACALLLSLPPTQPHPDSTPQKPLLIPKEGLYITGAGFAEELPISELFNGAAKRSIPMTHAMRTACEVAQLAPSEIDFRASDQNGEDWLMGEGVNAFTRLLYQGGDKDIEFYTTADTVGEVGAASGGVILGLLTAVLPRIRIKNKSAQHHLHNGLIHLSNEAGLRAAMTVQHLRYSNHRKGA